MTITPAPTVQSLSALDRDAFVAALHGIFEHSPWVAERAWSRRPFADRAALGEALVETMMAASRAEQLALVRAHPELAGKAAIAGDMTRESISEQGGAGLNACSPEEFAQLQALNEAYNAKFGHPFILSVRGRSRAEIIAAFELRLSNDVETEFAESLRQIARIARLRLEERFPT